MRSALDALALPYVQEAKVGRFSVDFLLPEQSVAVEVDGAYWHRDVARDERRTQALNSHGLRVVRVDAALLGAQSGTVEFVRTLLL